MEINPAGIKISRTSAVPLYTQVYEQFRGMIIEGRLRAGERLPASRNLSKELGVSRIIISQAFEQLIIEGYLVGKTGSGTFVATVLPDNLLHAGKTAAAIDNKKTIDKAKPKKVFAQNWSEDIIPFQLGTPSLDHFPYKIWQQVATKVLKDLKHFNLGYNDVSGYYPLRESIASYLRLSRAVKCEASQVIVVTGSQQGLNLVAASLLQQGDKVWMEDPGYPGAITAFENAHVQLCPVPIEKDGLDVAHAIKKFPDATLAYVTPSHQFPLGCTLSETKRTKLLQYAYTQKMWILEDDYDSEFRYEGNPLPSLQGLDNNARVIYSGTFSKVMFPALRLAYLVLPSAEMIKRFEEIKLNLDRQSPIMEQVILHRFMEEGHFLRHIRKMRLLYAERQKILIGLMQEQLRDYIRLDIAPSGMHLLCWLSEKIDAEKLRQEIKKQKLVAGFISDYSVQQKLPPAISLGYTAFSKYKLKTGVEKLKTAVLSSLVK